VGEHDVGEGVALERRHSDQELEGDDAKAVEVRALVLRAFGRLARLAMDRGAAPV